MFPATTFDQNLEVCDASGTTVGFLVPERAFRDLLAEREALRRQVAELRQEVLALRAQAEKVAREKDERIQTLRDLCRELVPPITAEELAEMKKDGISFARVVDEVEQIVAGNPCEG
jgi:alkylation response protein AidB-like acyl-CoA dehydrogenase